MWLVFVTVKDAEKSEQKNNGKLKALKGLVMKGQGVQATTDPKLTYWNLISKTFWFGWLFLKHFLAKWQQFKIAKPFKRGNWWSAFRCRWWSDQHRRCERSRILTKMMGDGRSWFPKMATSFHQLLVKLAFMSSPTKHSWFATDNGLEVLPTSV